MNRTNSSTLVVCPDVATAERYAEWLTDLTEVTAATDRTIEGCEASSYEVAVLDDRLVDGNGHSIIEDLHSKGQPARIVLLAAEEPDPSIVRRGIDECLLKPIEPADLKRCVQTLQVRVKYERELQTFYELVSKRASIEDGRRGPHADASEEWIRIRQEIAAARESVDRTLKELSTLEGYPGVFQAMMVESD